jgi:glyoxalase/bleomycin resistance protein/dioxygenase superfamily protein
MRAADQFHVGIVVADLEASLAELAALFGYEWCDEIHLEQPVQFPSGERNVEFRFRYSRDTPRLEVIEARAGTVWTPAAGSGIHHLGYWSDDVAGDGAALEQSGFSLEAAGVGGDGVRFWSYHRSPSGPRIELVSRALEPMLSQMWE